jgi:hypothetical protein
VDTASHEGGRVRAAFDRWWRASKYCQVVIPEPHWEQIALDSWQAAEREGYLRGIRAAAACAKSLQVTAQGVTRWAHGYEIAETILDLAEGGEGEQALQLRGQQRALLRRQRAAMEMLPASVQAKFTSPAVPLCDFHVRIQGRCCNRSLPIWGIRGASKVQSR